MTGARGRLRDAGLRRVARGTRLLAVGSVAVAGIFSLLAARAHPGTSAHQVTSNRHGAVITPPTVSGTGAAPLGRTYGRSPGLSPSPPPRRSHRPPVTTSGAS